MMVSQRTTCLVALAAGWLAAATPNAARAQEAGESAAAPEDGGSSGGHAAPREAVELFQRAREAYRTGQYDAAARDLEAALVIDPSSPTLLFNLARVYELQGDLPRAIDVYRNYRRVIPEADEAERARADAAILRLEGAQGYTRPDEDAYSQPLYVSQRGVADEAFWGTLGAGAAITLGAVAMIGATLFVRDAADQFAIGRDGDLTDRAFAYQNAADLALATDITGGVGGATLVAAALLWGVRERTVEMFPQAPATRVSVGVTGTAAGLRVGGSF